LTSWGTNGFSRSTMLHGVKQLSILYCTLDIDVIMSNSQHIVIKTTRARRFQVTVV